MKNEATDFRRKQWEIRFKKILKCLSSDITEWHDVAAGRGSLCNWMMEGARYFSVFPHLPSFIKGVYLQNVVLKFSGSE